MSAKFTEDDRRFIRVIANSVTALEKRMTALETIGVVNETKPRKKRSKVHEDSDMRFKGSNDSSVEVTFLQPEANLDKQRVLIESVYQTLRDLCSKHGIATMDIFINNTRQNG